MNYLLLLIAIAIIDILYYNTNNLINQSTNDWNTLYDLENRVKTLKTKEDIIEYHKEFVQKANKINNQYISPRLAAIDGYVRGLYEQYKNK